jgi:hypothetical protein
MRRIIMFVVVALVMAAMLLAMAMPAFAQGAGHSQQPCKVGSHPVPTGTGQAFDCVPNGPPAG